MDSTPPSLSAFATWSRVDVLIVAGLVIVAGATWSLHGFYGWLYRDDAVYLYAGQQLLNGVMPYESIFDHKTPLASILCAIGTALGRAVGLDDVVGARAFYFLLNALSIGAIYAATRVVVRERWAAILSALLLIGAWSFGREAVSGPNAKSPMVLFEALFLWCAMRRKWFGAGCWAALTTWTWQPGACFLLAGAAAAWLQNTGAARRRAWIRLGGGVLLPTLLLGGWFAATGALGPLIEGSTLFNLIHLERHPPELAERILRPIRVAATTNGYAGIPLLVGLLWWIGEIIISFRSKTATLEYSPRLPLLLALPFPFIWSFFDFQGGADFYPFLPFACIGLALLLERVINAVRAVNRLPSKATHWACAGLAVIAVFGNFWLYHDRSENMLLTQRYAAELVDQAYGRDAPILSIGLPEILVLQGKTNPNRYVFIINGIDNLIDARTPGGFSAWVERLEVDRPPLVAWGPTEGPHVPRLREWLDQHYLPRTFGYWKIYERR